MSPDGKLLYLGGQTARAPYGRIAIYDVGQRQIVGGLPLEVPDNDARAMERLAHLEPVVSVAVSPDGKRLASASSDGEIRVWDLAAPIPANGQTPSLVVRPRAENVDNAAATSEIVTEHRVLWVADDRLVASERTAQDRWSLAEFQIGANAAIVGRYPATLSGGVGQLARGERFWASSERGGRVLVWDRTQGPDQQPRVINVDPGTDTIPYGLSLAGDLLSVTVNRSNQRGSDVQVWNLRDLTKRYALPTSAIGRAFACVLDATGKRVLSHVTDSDSDDPNADVAKMVDKNGGLDDAVGGELVSFRLKTPEGSFRGQGDVVRSAVVTRGRGLTVWHVAFPRKAGDYRIAFSQDAGDRSLQPTWTGRVSRVFDLAKGQLVTLFREPKQNETPEQAEARAAAEQAQFRQPMENADGWSTTIQRQTVVIRKGGNPVAELIFSGRLEQFLGRPFTSALIPDAAGKPIALAIGTSTINGIFVYSLPSGNRAPELIRYYRDHFGKVNSLGVSADGKYLISGSSDHTMKVWSLAGLAIAPAKFPASRAWGCDFEVEGNQLVVRNVLPAGIAAGRGLAAGDVIGEVREFETRNNAVTDAAAMRKLLAEKPIYTEFILKVLRAGKVVKAAIAVVPAWEPLVTLYVDARGEWAAFTPEGYFNSSAAEGADLFGWQINVGPAITPEFRIALDLSKEFEREDLLRELLSAGSLPGAFRNLGKPVPGGGDFPAFLAGVSNSLAPKVRIVEPANGVNVAGGGALVPFKAEVTIPAGSDPANFPVTVTSNGEPLPVTTAAQPQPDGSTKVEVTGTADPDTQLTRLRAQVEEKDVFPAFSSSDQVQLRSDETGSETRYELFFVGIGCQKYPDGSMYGPLNYSQRDVTGLRETLKDPEGAAAEYDFQTSVPPLFDEQVSEEEINERFKQIERQVKEAVAKRPEERRQGKDVPKVLVVVHIAGHGDFVEKELSDGRVQRRFFFIPTTRTIGAAEAKDVALPLKGIPWQAILKFSQLQNCQKLFVIDACHSGSAIDDQVALKTLRRPFNTSDSIVFSATKGAGETASEDDNVKHGVFSFNLMQAVKGQADGFSKRKKPKKGDATSPAPNKDGLLRLEEISDYVIDGVVRHTDGGQTPKIGPEQLVKSLHPAIVFTRLQAAPPAAAGGGQ
jgi:WD40 repeat protein